MKMKFRSDHFIMSMNNSSGEFRFRELRKEKGLASKNIFISLAGFSLLQFGLKIRRGAWDLWAPPLDMPMIRIRNN